MLGDNGPVRRSDRFCSASRRRARAASTVLRVLACVLLLTASVGSAQSLPSGAKVVSGSATVTQTNGQQLVINQGSNNAIINWQSFSIGHGDSVTFVQPGANSVALNRVIGASPSAIYGSLSATGKVFLVNPAGVLFAPGASVNTGSFVASTLGISDSDFLAGRYTFQNGGAASGIVNQGTVNARDGAVVFIAPQIVNAGSISATSGVALAAGDRVSMTLDADSPLSVSVDASALKAGIVNSGTVFSGGPVMLSAQARDSALDTVINSSGVIRAASISSDGEDIQLNGGAQGIVSISGTLDASGSGAHGRGGSVEVSGDQLTLAGTARLDASGAAGGGAILVGGAAHGAGTLQNASTTTIAQGAVLDASATGQGNGGQVVVWSNDSTRFAGQIVARGGASGGDGGSAEVSSKGALIFEGAVDLSAPYGRRGTLLLDPDDLCIVSAADATCGAAATGTGTGGATFQSAGGSYVLSSTLSTLSTTANLVLQATNDIIFKTNLSLATSTSASNGSITLTAGNAIQMNGNSLSTDGGNILMTAGSGGMTLGSLSAGAGTITLGLTAANGVITQASGSSISGTGGLTFNGGTLQLNQANTYSGGTNVTGGTLALSGGGTAGASSGAITVASGGALDVQNLVTVTNPVTLSGGTLETTTGNGTVSNTVTLNGSSTLTAGSGAVLTVSGDVSGSAAPGGLNVGGAGTVVLTGSNSYTGGTTLASGATLSGNTGSLIGSFTNNGTLVFNQASDGTFSGGISGTGTVVKQNTGTLVLSASQSYSGGTSVVGGVLQGDSSSLQGNINLASTTTGLVFDQASNGTFGGTIGGSGTVTKQNAGTLIFNSVQGYSGSTNVTGGTLAVSGAGTAGTAGGSVNVGSGAALDVQNTLANAVTLAGGTLETTTGNGTVNGTVKLNGGNTFSAANTATLTVNGVVSDGTTAGVLAVSGLGKVVLTGLNSYTGGTNVNSGTLALTGSGTAGASSGTITVAGGGALDVQNAVTVTNAVRLSGGTLETTTGSGTVSGAVTLNGSSTFSTGSGAVLTVGGVVSGSAALGGLNVDGAGTVVLTGSNNYTGGTTLASGATLSGNTGSLIGSFTNNGTLVFNQASDGTFSGGISGTGTVVKQNTGTLVLSASQSYTGGTSVVGGALQGDSSSLQGSINLASTTTGLVFDQASNGTFGGTIGGSGTVTKQNAGTLIFNSVQGYSGSTNVTGGTLAVSGTGTAGTAGGSVNVGSGAALDVQNTLANAVTLAGGTLETTTGSGTVNGAVTLNGSSTFSTGGSAVLTVNGIVSGSTPSSGLNVSGPGTVVLTGRNTYAGGTTLASGTLQGNTNSLQGGIVNSGSLVFDQATNGTFNGTVSGTGTVTKQNTGTLTFNTAQNYSGGTAITGGTLAITGAGTAGGPIDVSGGAALDVQKSLPNAVNLAGGTLETTSGTGVVNGAVTLNGSSTFATGSGAVLAVNGIVSGATPSSGLNVSGTGTVVLTGLNAYSGGTKLASGTLQGNTNSLQGAITNSGTLVFDQASNGTFGGTISGNGTVVKQNVGTLVLSAPQSYTGGTAVTGGVLQGNSSSLQGNIGLASATGLVFDQTSVGTFSGQISGVGTVTKQNTGTLTFNTAQNYSGGTDITGGTLALTGAGTAGTSGGAVNVGGGSALDVQTTLPNSINLAGGTLETTSGSGTVNGAVTLYGGGTFVTGNAATLAVKGAIADGMPHSALTVGGTGLVTLTGVNTYSGGTTLASGTLQGNTNSLQGGITNNASLIFDQASNGTFGGAISGAGTVTKQNTGTLTFNTAQTYTGGTRVTGGTLAVTNGGTAGGAASAITVGNGAALDVQNTLSNAVTLAGGTLETISGAGVVNGPVTVGAGGGASIAAGANASLSVNGVIGDDGTGQALTKLGTGLVTLNGANSYRGGTTVQAGTLALGAAGSLGSGVATVDGGATLRLNGTTLSSNLSLLDGSTLAATGSMNALTGTLNVRSATFDIGSGSTLNASSAFNHFTGTTTLTGGGSLNLRVDSGGIQLGATSLANLGLQSDGAVTQAAAATINGTTSIATTGNAPITLGAANQFGGALQLSGGPASVTSVGALTFGTSSVASLNVSAGGDITQTGVLAVAGASNFSTPNGNLNLGLANTFGGLVNVSAAGGSLNSAQDLTVALSTPGTMNVTAGGALTLSGTAGTLSTTSGGTTTFGVTQVGDALTIVAGDQVTTSSGASVNARSIMMTLPVGRDIGAARPGEFVLSNVDKLTLLSGHDAFFLLPDGQQTRFSIGAQVGCARVNMGPCIGNEALVSAVSSVQSGIQQTVINQMHQEDEFTLKVKYGFAGDLQQVQTYPHEGDLEVRQPEACQLADHAVAEAQGGSVRLRARETCP